MDRDTISASELERFGYCPLSWWLSLSSEVTSEPLEKGEKEHEKISEDLETIMDQERKASGWQTIVLLFSVVATALALIGISFTSVVNAHEFSTILAGISILWIGAALLFLYRSVSSTVQSKRARNEQLLAIAAIIAAIVALNSVTVLEFNPELAHITEVIALIWLIGASLALHGSLSSQKKAESLKKTQMIEGKITYIGTPDSKLIRSEKYGLTGRPDYIIESNGEVIPIDLKTGRKPKGPLFSHVMQIAAYCLLLSEETGKPVTHGILRYGDVEHEIEFNEELRSLLLSKLDEMRALKLTMDVHRNHNRPGKCRSCSRRENCPERLE